MIPFFCQWIDRVAIHHAAARMPKPDGRDLHLEEAKHLLQNLDFSPAEMSPLSLSSPARQISVFPVHARPRTP